jgi:hypothetical protein
MLSKWQEALIAEGIDVSLFGWLLAMEHQTPIITGEADFPTDIEGFKPYTDKLRPRSGKNVVWLLLHVGCDANPDNLLSTTTSKTNWWYRDHNSACYPYDVQDSDDAIEVGTLAFSGVHCDSFRLARVLEDLFVANNRGDRLKHGCTVKMYKGYPKGEKNYGFPKERVVVISADRRDAPLARTILYHAFNRRANPMDRPGQYNFRLVPAPDLVSLGSNASDNRERMQQKHSAVMDSLLQHYTTDIKDLDVPYSKDGFTYTLRELILTVRYPLGSDSPAKLYFSVDKAMHGYNLPACSSILTAYSDRESVATSFLRVLPAYVGHMVDEQAARLWLFPQAIAACRDVTLISWKKTWELPCNLTSPPRQWPGVMNPQYLPQMMPLWPPLEPN